VTSDSPADVEAAKADLRGVVRRAGHDLREQLFDLLDLLRDDPTRIRLSLIADDAETLRALAAAYQGTAAEESIGCALWQFLPAPGKREPIAERDWTPGKLRWDPLDPPPKPLRGETWQLRAKSGLSGLPAAPLLLRQRVADPARFLAGELTGVLGLLFEFSGPRVGARFAGEEGLHRFVFAQRKTACAVRTALPPLDEHLPPWGLERRGAVTMASKCRDYDFVKQVLVDAVLPKPVNFAPQRLGDGVRTCIDQRHRWTAEQLLDA
jgi:hypothetical protein